MAKIKTLALELLGEVYNFQINCNSKGVFTVAFPASVWDVEKVCTDFTTLEAAEKEIRRAVKVVNEAETTVEDVIRYAIAGDNRKQHWHDQVAEFASLEICFIALRRTVRGKMTRYNKIDFDVFNRTADPDGIAPGYRVLANQYDGTLLSAKEIPFSVDAMEFFTKMRGAVLELRKKMDEFTAPANVLSFLSGGSVLALPFENDLKVSE